MNSRSYEKPHIAVFMDQLPPGSSPKIAGEEVRQLNKLGLNADLLLIKRNVQEKDREWLDGVSLECLEDQFPPLKIDFKMPGFSFFSLFHLTTPIYGPFILKKRYDLIIAHGTYTCFTAYSLRKVRNIPYIAFIWDPIIYILCKVYSSTMLKHMFSILYPLGEKIDKMIADSSEAVVLPSRYHLDLMRKLTHQPINIVYPGVEAAENVPKKRGDYILAVARWEYGKRPFFYLDLLEKLKEDNLLCDLIMVGPWKESSLRLLFQREVKERGLTDHVKLYGPAGKDELEMFYREARVLVHAVAESFGMIGLEAAAHGCPFIIPKKSGVTDLFNHGIHGFFPQEGDLNGFVKSVEKLISDERLAWKMGYEAWKIAKKYTWESHARELLRALS